MTHATDLTASRCAASAFVNDLLFLLRTEDHPALGPEGRD